MESLYDVGWRQVRGRCLVERIQKTGTAHVSTRQGHMTSAVSNAVSNDAVSNANTCVGTAATGCLVERSSTVRLEVLPMSAPFGNQPHRRLADPRVTVRARVVEALAPGQGRDVAIFVHGLVWDEAQPLTQRSPSIGISAVVQEQTD